MQALPLLSCCHLLTLCIQEVEPFRSCLQAYPREPLNQSAAALSGSFVPAYRFENLEIHKVFLQFPNLNLEQNPSLTALAIESEVPWHMPRKMSSTIRLFAPSPASVIRRCGIFAAHGSGRMPVWRQNRRARENASRGEGAPCFAKEFFAFMQKYKLVIMPIFDFCESARAKLKTFI